MVLSVLSQDRVYFLLINNYSYLITPKKIGYNFDKILHIFLLILGVGK
ncbi:hypothetical protein SMUE_14360 [Enterococcus cecorum]